MKMTIKKEVEEEVEIDLPVYLKGYGGTYYKQSEAGYVKVTDWDGGKLRQSSIEVSEGYTLPNSFFSFEQMPEAEFNEVYQKALSQLTLEPQIIKQ